MGETRYAFFRGGFVPLAEARISIVTHAFNYGTGVFEGIRGYWNADQGQLFLLQMQQHFERLLNSCRIMRISLPYSVAELCDITVELARRNGHREDVYVRPLAYKGSEVIGVRLHDLEDHFAIFTVPFGAYLAIDKGIRCCVSSWRRVDDNMIPARAKVTGVYVNSALPKTEAVLDGYDEAIVLGQDGHVCEGSAENIFLVQGGCLVTPPAAENILVGITRNAIIQLARDEFGMETIERQVARNELYTSDEVFLCGTGAQISPVLEIDRRPVGQGAIGPITRQLSQLYFEIVRGNNAKYADWCQPVYPAPIA